MNIYDIDIELENNNIDIDITYEETEYPIEIIEDPIVPDDISIEYLE